MSSDMSGHLTLVSLRYSPWSERAHWALDHHGIAYQSVRHEPFLGEPRLRKLAGHRRGRVTVPLLLTGDEALMESFEIARFADRHGGAESLVPPEHEASIRELNELVERTMMAGRGLTTAALLADPAALDEALPRGVPSFVRPLLRPLSRFGTRWFARKYELDLADRATPVAALAETLATLRARYAGRDYCHDRFSYADILFCSLLQAISPVSDRYIRLGPAWRRAWTIPELARDFADLVAHRDELYARHRKSRTAS
jgi:glutathione S-transferase